MWVTNESSKAYRYGKDMWLYPHIPVEIMDEQAAAVLQRLSNDGKVQMSFKPSEQAAPPQQLGEVTWTPPTTFQEPQPDYPMPQEVTPPPEPVAEETTPEPEPTPEPTPTPEPEPEPAPGA